MSKVGLYRLVWIPSLVAILGMLAVFMGVSGKVPPPGPMKRYTTGDKFISIKHPGNWKAHELSANATFTTLRFEPVLGSRMVITSDLAGSLLSDMDRANSASLPNMSSSADSSSTSGIAAGMPTMEAKLPSPLEKSHASQKDEMEKDYTKYEEGATAKLQIDGQEALATDFNYETGEMLTHRLMAGKRVTLLSGDRHVAVICTCLRDMKATVMPTYDKMIASLRVSGQNGG